MDLKDTIEMMNSDDYKERFKAEYYQTKIRYEKLKRLNTRIRAQEITDQYTVLTKHDCPGCLLRDQQRAMGQYLHLLEVRAVIEKIEL